MLISSGGAATFNSSASNNFIINSTEANGGYIRLQRSGVDLAFIGSAYHTIVPTGANTDLGINCDSGNIIFASGGSEKMRITSGGVLQLFGTATANALSVSHDSSNNVEMSIPFQDVNQDIVIINSSAGVRLDYAATSWVSNSDENIKENIVSLENVLDKIKDIRCVNYNLKDEEIYKKRLGFIAQDFQKDFKEVVSESNEGILGLHYTETIPILMKAIQEQQTIIEDLKARIEQLEL